MKKPLKYALLGLGGLLALFLLALAVIALTFDPNDYKDEIERVVEERTGRELTIHGDLELALFPWLAVRAGAIELGNAAGFGPAPFARLEGLEVRVKLLPLLAKRIEIGTVVVRGLKVELARDAAGANNWADLVRDEAPKEAAPEQDAGYAVDVGEFRLEDAALGFTDAAASRAYRIEKLRVATGAVRPGAPIELEAAWEAHATNPTLDAAFDFRATVVPPGAGRAAEVRDAEGTLRASGGALPLEMPDGRYAWNRVIHDAASDAARVEGFTASALGATLTLDLEAQALSGATVVTGGVTVPAFTPAPALRDFIAARLPAGAQPEALAPLAFATRFKFAPAAQELELTELAAQALGLAITGRASGVQVVDAPQLAGRIAVAEFAPRRVMQALGMAPPATADPKALERMSLDADFSYAPNAVRLERFTLGLDGAKLTGGVALDDVAKRALRFDLALDAIDLDRYLPPAAADAADQTQEGALDELEVPAALIRKLDVAGNLRAGRLTLSGIKTEDLRVTITAREAALAIAPFGAKLYGGTVSGRFGVDARRGEPRADAALDLKGVQLKGLFADAFDSSLLTGTARFDASLAGQGRTVGELRRSLGGKLAFAVEDGAIEGFDLWHAIRGAYAKVKGRPAPKVSATPRTVFEQLSGSAAVAEGVLTNQDLVAAVPFLRVKGAGKVDLVAEAIRYKVTAAVVGTPNFGPGEDLSGLAGLTFPVDISGKFSAIEASPDLVGALKATAKEKATDEVKAKAKDKLKKKLEKLIK